MSTEDQKARVYALMTLADAYAQAVSTAETSTHECWRSIDYRNKRIAEQRAAREALRSALMSNAAPEVDRSEIRRAALQEAAEACESVDPVTYRFGGQLHDDAAGTRVACAAAIRALADPLQALHDNAEELGLYDEPKETP